MTFLELEKKCKRRRLKKVLLFLFIIVLVGVMIVFVNKKQSKKETVFKEKNITVNKIEFNEFNKSKFNEFNKSNEKKRFSNKLKFMIDLNSSKKSKNSLKKQNDNLEDSNFKIKIDKNESIEKNTEILKTEIIPSYDTCIELAKSYYKKGNFQKALKWAKYANLQDKEKPEAWIITAKSLYKLGKKDKALEILKIYYGFHPENKEVLSVLKKLKESE